MVVEFTTGVNSVPITTIVVNLNPADGEVYSMQHYLIKFVSDLQQAGGVFFSGTPVSSTNKADRYDITEILFNVALNIISPTYTLFKVQ